MWRFSKKKEITKGYDGLILDYHPGVEEAEQAKINNEMNRGAARAQWHEFTSSNPSLRNLFGAAYSYWKSVPFLGGESENPSSYYALTGTAPLPGIGKATSAKEALAMVKAMKLAKAAKLASTPRQVKAAAKAKLVLPKDLDSSGLTKSGKANIKAILEKLPEAERDKILESLMQNKNFWSAYGNGVVNVSPSRAAGIINAIRRKLGFLNGSSYGGQVKYGPLMSGFKASQVEDATRLTTGIKRTTRLKPE